MAGKPQQHPDDELLECYALERLEEPALGEVEEHLLLCKHCQDRLDEATEFAEIMREAAGNVEAAAEKEPWWERLVQRMRMPAPALAGALSMAVVLFIWQPWRATPPRQWQTIELETLRGGGAEKANSLADHALELRLDVTGLDATGTSAQIVDAGGRAVAELSVEAVAGKALARYAGGLTPGQYWVRLKKNGETLREYALPVTAR